MPQPLEYSVGFGEMAWTLSYRDSSGDWKATFDCDLDSLEDESRPQRIVLNAGIRSSKSDAIEIRPPLERQELIMRRVQNYLESIGYEVSRFRP
jgi:hypothetical protein